jgi:hypothetical protein
MKGAGMLGCLHSLLAAINFVRDTHLYGELHMVTVPASTGQEPLVVQGYHYSSSALGW